MEKTRTIVSVVMAVVLATWMLCGCSRDSEHAHSNALESSDRSASSGQHKDAAAEVASTAVSVDNVRFVLIVSSETCQCALEKCRENEKYLAETLRRLGLGSNLDIVDHAKEEDKAVQLFKEYRVHFIPSFLVLDGDGKVLFKNEWDIDHIAFEELLTSLGNTQ